MSAAILSAIAGDGAAVLHRLEVEDGPDIHFGREAALALLAGLRPAMEKLIVPDIGDRRCAMLRMPGADVWAWLEAGRIARLALIRQRSADDGDPAAFGAARPCHRPLGELLSGRGQLGPISAGHDAVGRFVAAWNSRDPGLAELMAPVLAIAGDAVLVEQERLPLDGGDAVILCRLLGHADGRRVSLPLSAMLLTPSSVHLCVDGLALAATPHRPFWPD